MSSKNTKVQRVAAGTTQTIPTNLTPAGQTMSTTGVWLTGVGTSFTTTLSPGAWIYSSAGTEVRKVVQVVSNTSAQLESAFTADIAAATPFNYVPLSYVKEIKCAVGSLITYTVDGVAIPAGVSLAWGKTSGMKDTATNGWVDPIIVNASGGADVIVTSLLYY